MIRLFRYVAIHTHYLLLHSHAFPLHTVTIISLCSYVVINTVTSASNSDCHSYTVWNNEPTAQAIQATYDAQANNMSMNNIIIVYVYEQYVYEHIHNI